MNTTTLTPTWVWNRIIQTCIRVYRRSPLYPQWGKCFAKLLHLLGRSHTSLFVHDCGRFRLNIDLNQVIDSHIYYNGSFEPDAVNTISQLVTEDAKVVDIGANIGCHTLHLASCVGPGGRVIAFEPTAWARGRLIDNLALNQFQQVVVQELGLSDQKGSVETSIQSSYRLDGGSDETNALIHFVTLDEYFVNNPVDRLDFIKIDTDGMEFRILRGAENTLRRFKPHLLFEVAPEGLEENGSSAVELLEWLRKLGYEFYHDGSLKPYSNELDSIVRRISTGTSQNVVAISKDNQRFEVAQ